MREFDKEEVKDYHSLLKKKQKKKPVEDVKSLEEFKSSVKLAMLEKEKQMYER